MPLFSIGITTYNRPELLKEAVACVLSQSFQDFEILIGNDYVAKPVSMDSLGVTDCRIKVYNHPRNLGEIGNMNFLFEKAEGAYFTWLSDDDLFHPEFLSATRRAIERYQPEVVFTNFHVLSGLISPQLQVLNIKDENISLIKGREFLKAYWKADLKTMACNAIYDRRALKKIGGLELLCDERVGLYSEYMLLMRCGLLEKICYVDQPLAYYRSHEGSAVATMPLKATDDAGREMLKRSLQVMSAPEFQDDFDNIFSPLARMCLLNYYRRARQDSRVVALSEINNYIHRVSCGFTAYDGAIARRAAACCRKEGKRIIWRCIKDHIQAVLPVSWVQAIWRARHRDVQVA